MFLDVINKVKEIVHLNKTLVENFSFISLLEVFLLLVPLITYPYLVRVIGTELYGKVIVAQVLASYASILISFGIKEVGAKFIAINKNNKDTLSTIFSSLLFFKFILWLISLLIFCVIVYIIPSYRENFLLFLFAYGITFNDFIFPQFFFQGIEKMKYITIINILIRSFFLVLIFIFVNAPNDYILVPLFYSIGYLCGGIISLYLVFVKENVSFVKPSMSSIKMILKEAKPVFGASIICTIKDQLGYLLIGQTLGYSEVTLYDLGLKISAVIGKPISIISTVVFPRIAINKSIKYINKTYYFSILVTLVCSGIVLIFIKPIVAFFNPEINNLLPIKLFLLAPILSTSFFLAQNFFVTFGQTKKILIGMIATSLSYLIGVSFLFFMGIEGYVISFVLVALFSYFVEFLYRNIVYFKWIRKSKYSNVS